MEDFHYCYTVLYAIHHFSVFFIDIGVYQRTNTWRTVRTRRIL